MKEPVIHDLKLVMAELCCLWLRRQRSAWPVPSNLVAS